MKLLIVESPSKVRKISSILGAGWAVEASFGHIRDLPADDMGIGENYDPVYEIPERSRKQAAKLKGLVRQMSEIWLATDPDREGEAIAWHLSELLGKGKTVRRVTFAEITASAISKAVQRPREIDMRLVEAQQARRILDRLYGYKLSPALGNALGRRGLSAGRVQTIALYMIVEREREIRAFVPTTHYDVETLHDSPIGQWGARWVREAFMTQECPYITDKRAAEAVIGKVREGLLVSACKESERRRHAPPPLITSTLQQAAANRLGMSVSTTMSAAQLLFEEGLITYMRTDNPNLSEDGIAAVQQFLRDAGQEAHIAMPPNRWQSSESAQEAHEAIRPTDISLRQSNTGNTNADRLYHLIWRVTVACQMRPSIYKVRTVRLHSLTPLTLDALPNPQTALIELEGRGEERIYDGWEVLMKDDYTDEERKTEGGQLPLLQEGTVITPNDARILTLQTKAPKRYSETALVKALEKNGIGRPATYASIIETQLKREYAVLHERCFMPTALGEQVIESLESGDFAILDKSYTAAMETDLDSVAQGKVCWRDIVAGYDRTLDTELGRYQSRLAENAPRCPACSEGYLRLIDTPTGRFWGCSNFKKTGCRFTKAEDGASTARKKKRFGIPI